MDRVNEVVQPSKEITKEESTSTKLAKELQTRGTITTRSYVHGSVRTLIIVLIYFYPNNVSCKIWCCLILERKKRKKKTTRKFFDLD